MFSSVFAYQQCEKENEMMKLPKDSHGVIIADYKVSVDYFVKDLQEKRGINHHFLTHCHSDHTRGLDKSWNKTIYCSQVI